MINQAIFYGLLCLTFLWVNLWASIRIIAYLQSRGEKASMFSGGFFVKGKIFQYLPLYKRHTQKETGKTGSLYYIFTISFILFIISMIAGLMKIS